MKVAVLADIHGNLSALETVLEHLDSWKPDRVVVAGDIINRGPRPRECLEIVQKKQKEADWHAVRGNHEDYVLTHTDPNLQRSKPEIDIDQNCLWTFQQLNSQVTDLEQMPFQVAFSDPEGQEVRIVHASMRGNREGIYLETPEARLRQLIEPPPALLGVGHTHRPLVRTIDNTLVVNVGAVGLPFDGDIRSAYAQLTWQKGRWHVRIIRLNYDRVRAERDYFATGFIPDAGDLARIMLVEFYQARSHIHKWMWNYQDAVLDGSLSLSESVQAYLTSLSI